MKLPHDMEPAGIASHAYESDIILLDLVEYSLLPNERQYLAIYYLNKIIRNITQVLELHACLPGERLVQGFLPNGDGSYLILNPRLAGYGPLFALFLRNFLLFNNRTLDNLYKGVRIAVHHGSVIPIDFLDTENYVGDGLNVCARLLVRIVNAKAREFYGEDSLVVVSGCAWDAFERQFPPAEQAVRDYLARIQFRSSRPYRLRDKHRSRPDYRIRFIDSARDIGSAPPRPTMLQVLGDGGGFAPASERGIQDGPLAS